MDITYLLLLLLPLFSYVLCEKRLGVRKALIIAMAMVTLLLVYEAVTFREVDPLTLLESGLLLLFGGLSLYAKNPKFFKLQPVIVAFIFVCVLSWYQVFDQPLLVKYLPKMQAVLGNMPMDIAAMTPKLTLLSLHLIFLMIFHGLLTFWAATRKSTSTWMWVRLSLFPMVTVMTLIDQQLYFS